MQNETDWSLLVKVGLSVAGAVSLLFIGMIRWIVGDQLTRNQADHSALQDRCKTLEEKLEGVATQADFKSLRDKMDRWQENRVTIFDINYQNKILDEIKKALGIVPGK